MVRERCAVPMAANPTAWKVLVSKIQISLSMLFVLLLVLLFFVFCYRCCCCCLSSL